MDYPPPHLCRVRCFQCGTDWNTSVGSNFKCLVCGAYLVAPSSEEIRQEELRNRRLKVIRLVTD